MLGEAFLLAVCEKSVPLRSNSQPDMSKEKKCIKEWALSDRPREKMLNRGKTALSDAELLAILIRSGSSDQTAVGLASTILESAGNNLITLSDFSIEDWMQHKGIGEAKALTVMAGLELGRRLLGTEANTPDRLRDSADAYKRLLPCIDDFSQEHFIVMYLDVSNTILKIECVSNGGMTHTIADPRIVFKNALNVGATRIIIAHNHPSGSLSPSVDDRRLTKKFTAAGVLLDITVIDHIILKRGGYYSFREHGEME